jgi:hypothetical protein
VLKGYDEWKTRSDLDDAQRYAQPERCFFCDAPLPGEPWAFWSSSGVTASLCDRCAPNPEPEQDA